MKANQTIAFQIPQRALCSEQFILLKSAINCIELIADWTADDLYCSVAAGCVCTLREERNRCTQRERMHLGD